MLIYIINIILILIYGKLIKSRKAFAIIVAVQMFLILALRSTTLGVDLGNYEIYYDRVSSVSTGRLIESFNIGGLSNYGQENGYTLLNWLASNIGLSFHGFLIILAAINIISISYFIYKYSEDQKLSYIIYCCFEFFAFNFGILRQSLALSMVLLSITFIDKKKPFKAIISFALAYSFHRTAIISIPLLLLMKAKNITRKTYTILAAISIPLLLLSSIIFNNILAPLISEMERINYVNHGLIINNLYILLITITIIVLAFYNFSKIKNKINSVACYASIFAVYYMTFGLYNNVLARAVQYYSIFIILLIPNVLDQYKNQKIIKLIKIIIYILLSGFMIIDIGNSELNPYSIQNENILWKDTAIYSYQIGHI